MKCKQRAKRKGSAKLFGVRMIPIYKLIGNLFSITFSCKSVVFSLAFHCQLWWRAPHLAFRTRDAGSISPGRYYLVFNSLLHNSNITFCIFWHTTELIVNKCDQLSNYIWLLSFFPFLFRRRGKKITDLVWFQWSCRVKQVTLSHFYFPRHCCTDDILDKITNANWKIGVAHSDSISDALEIKCNRYEHSMRLFAFFSLLSVQ